MLAILVIASIYGIYRFFAQFAPKSDNVQNSGIGLMVMGGFILVTILFGLGYFLKSYEIEKIHSGLIKMGDHVIKLREGWQKIRIAFGAGIKKPDRGSERPPKWGRFALLCLGFSIGFIGACIYVPEFWNGIKTGWNYCTAHPAFGFGLLVAVVALYAARFHEKGIEKHIKLFRIASVIALSLLGIWLWQMVSGSEWYKNPSISVSSFGSNIVIPEINIFVVLAVAALIYLAFTARGRNFLLGLLLICAVCFFGACALKKGKEVFLEKAYAIPGVINTPKDQPKVEPRPANLIQRYSVSADELTVISWPKNADGSEDLYWNYRTWKTPRPVLDYIRQKLQPPPEQDPDGQIPNESEDSGLSDSRENLWVNINPEDKSDLTGVVLVYEHR